MEMNINMSRWGSTNAGRLMEGWLIGGIDDLLVDWAVEEAEMTWLDTSLILFQKYNMYNHSIHML